MFARLAFKLTSSLPLFLLLIVFSPPGAFPQENRVATTLASKELDNVEFMALGELAERLGLRTFYSEKAHKVILYVGAAQVKFTAMNPFVQINDRMLQMPVETRYADDDILVPLQEFIALVRPLYPGEWPASLGGIVALPAPAPAVSKKAEAVPNITQIAVEEKANGTLIRVQTTQPFARKHIASRFSRGWFYLDIIGGSVAPGAVVPITSPGLVREIKPLQTGIVSQLSFRLEKEIDASRVIIGGQGNEILVSLPTQEVVPTAVLRNLELDRQKWQIDTIVLDPGHGGKDPGAIGPDGTKEKDVTLQVALKLKKLLERDLKVRVVMTRETDVFIPLDERTALANGAKGKLFISLHANANRSRRVDGVSTYFLGPAKTDEALEVALRENEVVKYESDAPGDLAGEEEFILTAMAQNAFNHESEDLAAIVQEEMQGGVGLRDRGVHQAGFRVLVGASMPNILVEMAFISNPKEAKLLGSGEVQQKIAKSIFNSIRRFKEKYEWGS